MAARLLLVPADTADLAADETPGDNPRVDFVELARHLDADILGFPDVDAAADRPTRWIARLLGRAAALAWLGWRRQASTVITLGHSVGLPFALLRRFLGGARHVMFVWDLRGPRRLLRVLGVRHGLHGVAACSTRHTSLARDALGVEASRLYALHAGADTSFFTPPQPESRDITVPERTGIVAVGRNGRDDATLLQALAGIPVPAVLVDDGPPPSARSAAGRIPVPPTVKRVTDRTAYDLLLLYRSASVAVLPLAPTTSSAAVPALYEALACGTPVVVSAVDGLADSLRGLGGVVTVPPGDAEALARAIGSLLVDGPRRAALGEHGCRIVASRSLDVFVQRMLAIVDQVESATPAPSVPAPRAVRAVA